MNGIPNDEMNDIIQAIKNQIMTAHITETLDIAQCGLSEHGLTLADMTIPQVEEMGQASWLVLESVSGVQETTELGLIPVVFNDSDKRRFSGFFREGILIAVKRQKQFVTDFE